MKMHIAAFLVFDRRRRLHVTKDTPPILDSSTCTTIRDKTLTSVLSTTLSTTNTMTMKFLLSIACAIAVFVGSTDALAFGATKKGAPQLSAKDLPKFNKQTQRWETPANAEKGYPLYETALRNGPGEYKQTKTAFCELWTDERRTQGNIRIRILLLPQPVVSYPSFSSSHHSALLYETDKRQRLRTSRPQVSSG